jgi:hypothetical protein
MTRSSPALAVVLLIEASGCSDPSGCGGAASSYQPVESDQVHGSHTFSVQGEREIVPLSFTFSSLPERWPPGSPVRADQLMVRLAFAYDGVETDGSFEMPGIAVSFGENWFGQSGPYPQPFGVTLSGPFFQSCPGAEGEACCEVDSSACTVGGALVIERMEGSPFPPVDVTWNVWASAHITQCLYDESSRPYPGLELEIR